MKPLHTVHLILADAIGLIDGKYLLDRTERRQNSGAVCFGGCEREISNKINALTNQYLALKRGKKIQ